MEIVWSDEADETFDEIVWYIRDKFTECEVDAFVVSVYEVLVVIQTHPKLFPVSKIRRLRSTRKAVIHPHTTLFYRIRNSKQITLITFRDNRKNALV
jgi:plasmid stabilization system protein ParE